MLACRRGNTVRIIWAHDRVEQCSGRYHLHGQCRSGSWVPQRYTGVCPQGNTGCHGEVLLLSKFCHFLRLRYPADVQLGQHRRILCGGGRILCNIIKAQSHEPEGTPKWRTLLGQKWCNPVFWTIILSKVEVDKNVRIYFNDDKLLSSLDYRYRYKSKKCYVFAAPVFV